MPEINVAKVASCTIIASAGEKFIKQESVKKSIKSGVVTGASVAAADLLFSSVPQAKSTVNSISTQYGEILVDAALATAAKQYMSGNNIMGRSSLKRFLYELGYIYIGTSAEATIASYLPAQLTGTLNL